MNSYDKIMQAQKELWNDEKVKQQATSSKIKVPSINVNVQAYQSAKEVMQHVGTDKIFKCKLNYYHSQKLLDGWYDYDSEATVICLYAKDKNDAISRLNLITQQNFDYSFEASKIEEIDEQEAQQVISSQIKQSIFNDLQGRILTLPTPAMYEEMKKSINWSINMLKKLRDQDEARKRAAWLETQEGKDWLAKYESDKAVLDKLEQQKKASQDKAAAKRQQQKDNEKDVIDILQKKSSKYPQYTEGIAPVTVEGGRKFKGNGFVISIEEGGRYDDTYWSRNESQTNAVIYDPAYGKLQKANIKFCKVDDTVTNEQCKEAFKDYCQKQVRNTIIWCKRKDPRKSDFETKRWARNIIKKYHPQIDVDKYIQLDQQEVANALHDRVDSTVNWALSLGYGQTKTERIIEKALSKKGIDYKKFESLISLKLSIKYGKPPKYLVFN